MLYDLENPYDAVIDQGVWNWLWPVLISFLALAFFGSGYSNGSPVDEN
ncbi:MAG: hypothetical protein U5K72_19015 [Balneolaceae bacterium]|nr:hypothetical protein [Balneolaceae bacterium]